MKNRFLLLFAVAAFLTVGALNGFAQMTPVQGTVKDANGPVYPGHIVWHNSDNNHDYNMKFNKKGQYQGLVQVGHYEVKAYREGTADPIYTIPKFDLHTDPDNPFQTYDITVPATGGSGSTAAAAVQPTASEKEEKQMSGEERKKYEEAVKKNEAVKKENAKIGNLNNLMNEARGAMGQKPPDYEKAITLMTQATTDGPNYDAPWGVLGDAELGAKDYEKAADAYQKAIQLNAASAKPKPEWQGVWNYNLGRVYVKLGKYPEAQAAVDAAAKDDPASAGKYYYNEGAELMNAGQTDLALAAFEKAIASNPAPPEAYYQKGVALIGKSTMQGNKLVAPPGTEEALNKYLELAPNGPNAPNAEELLKQIGAKITTKYKRK